MSNVHAASQEIRSRYNKINYLILSPGVFNLNGRDETSEGIDKKLALHYYARWRFIHDLLPSLEQAKKAGEEAKTISVLGAGKGGQIDVDDLGLKKSFSLLNAGLASATYNDLMLEVVIFLFRSMIIILIKSLDSVVRIPPSQYLFRSCLPRGGSLLDSLILIIYSSLLGFASHQVLALSVFHLY
jgi:hypothetical protein